MERIVQKKISSSESGMSLIDFLLSKYNYHSREEWLERISDGKILINSEKVYAERILSDGDLITYDVSSYPEPDVDANFAIIAENEDFIYINKPGNLPVHPAGPYFKNTLWWHLRQKYNYLHILTRLDRESSGILAVAKSKVAVAKFAKLVAEEKVRKFYLVIVFGDFPHEELLAEGYLFKSPSSRVRKKMSFSSQKPENEYSVAKTNFKKLCGNRNASLIEAELLSGRTHQIRATLSALSYPVIGDKLYGIDENYYLKFCSEGLAEEDYHILGAKRQMLHSHRLSIEIEGTFSEFIATIPSDFREVSQKYEILFNC